MTGPQSHLGAAEALGRGVGAPGPWHCQSLGEDALGAWAKAGVRWGSLQGQRLAAGLGRLFIKGECRATEGHKVGGRAQELGVGACQLGHRLEGLRGHLMLVQNRPRALCEGARVGLRSHRGTRPGCLWVAGLSVRDPRLLAWQEIQGSGAPSCWAGPGRPEQTGSLKGAFHGVSWG